MKSELPFLYWFPAYFFFMLAYCLLIFAVLPLIFGFFTTVGPGEVDLSMTDINNYLNFVLKLFFAFGVTFGKSLSPLICSSKLA